MNEPTVYKQVGEEKLRQLVDEFYRRVEQDPLLRPLFPADLAAGKHAQFLFIMQYFGGPSIYNRERGNPRLRMRHMPFAIGKTERDLWLNHMLAAVDAVEIAEPARTTMREYFDRAATFMINRADEDEIQPNNSRF